MPHFGFLLFFYYSLLPGVLAIQLLSKLPNPCSYNAAVLMLVYVANANANAFSCLSMPLHLNKLFEDSHESRGSNYSRVAGRSPACNELNTRL